MEMRGARGLRAGFLPRSRALSPRSDSATWFERVRRRRPGETRRIAQRDSRQVRRDGGSRGRPRHVRRTPCSRAASATDDTPTSAPRMHSAAGRNREQSVRSDVRRRHRCGDRLRQRQPMRARRVYAAACGVRLRHWPDVGEQEAAQRRLDGPPRPGRPGGTRAVPAAKRLKGRDQGFLLEVFFEAAASGPLTERSRDCCASKTAE